MEYTKPTVRPTTIQKKDDRASCHSKRDPMPNPNPPSDSPCQFPLRSVSEQTPPKSFDEKRKKGSEAFKSLQSLRTTSSDDTQMKVPLKPSERPTAAKNNSPLLLDSRTRKYKGFNGGNPTKRNDKNFTFTNRTTTIKMALLVFMLLIGRGTGQTITLTNVSVDTTATATAMPSYVNSGANWKDTASQGPIWAGVTALYVVSPNLKVFNKDGALLCQTTKSSSIAGGTITLAIQDPLKLFIGNSPGGRGTMFFFDMVYNSPTWFISSSERNLSTDPPAGSVTIFNGRVLNWPGTTLIYFGQFNVNLLRVDTSSMSGQQNNVTGHIVPQAG